VHVNLLRIKYIMNLQRTETGKMEKNKTKGSHGTSSVRKLNPKARAEING